MDILAVSVWLRYLELSGSTCASRTTATRATTCSEIARALRAKAGDRLRHIAIEITDGLHADESEGGDKELHVDALIARARQLLGEADYRIVFNAGLTWCLADIRNDLTGFGVVLRQFLQRALAGYRRLRAARDPAPARQRPPVRAGRRHLVPRHRLRRRQGPGGGARERRQYLFRLRPGLPAVEVRARLRPRAVHLRRRPPRLHRTAEGGGAGPGPGPGAAGDPAGAVRDPVPRPAARADVHPRRQLRHPARVCARKWAPTRRASST